MFHYELGMIELLPKRKLVGDRACDADSKGRGKKRRNVGDVPNTGFFYMNSNVRIPRNKKQPRGSLGKCINIKTLYGYIDLA